MITQLGTGEALVSVLEDKGIPSIVGRTLVRPPSSRMGPITPLEREAVLKASPVAGTYDTTLDRESAYELLDVRAKQALRDAELAERDAEIAKLEAEYAKRREKEATRRSSRQTPMEAALTTFARSVARQAGSSFVRGVLGSLTRKR